MHKIQIFGRSTKAISPVISVLLMIAIAVVASLVAFAWVMGYIGNTTSKSGNALQIQGYCLDPEGSKDLIVYVQNVGQGPIALDPSSSVYIDSALQSFEGDSVTLAPGNTQALKVLYNTWIPGSQITIKVVSSTGIFAQVSGSGTTSSTGTSSSSYVVTFATIGGGGNSATSPEDTQNYYVGQQVTITALPDSGYSFLSWTATPTGSITFDDQNAISTTATIKGEATITATFTQITYQVSFRTSGGGAGAITSPTGTQTYIAGQEVPISAIADATHGFCMWTATGSITFDSSTSASTNAHINGEGTITAFYSPFGLDGSNSTKTVNSNTMTLALTTSQANDVLYLSWVGNTGRQSIASVSTSGSSPGTSLWTQRASMSANNDNNQLIQTWYAISSTAGTYTITVTLSDTNGNCAAVLCGVSGANTVSPFDGNPTALITGLLNPGATGRGSITTTNANDFIIGTIGVEHSQSGIVAYTPFTLISHGDASSRFVATARNTVTSVGTYQPTFAWNSNNKGTWGVISDAIMKG